MKLLVLGGTVFLGHAIAAYAVARGHEVTCAARGTGDAPAPLVRIDRDDLDGLAPLSGEEFDAVVDVAKISYPHVRRAVETIKAGHWTYVSSISAYAEYRTGGIGDPLAEPVQEHGDPKTMADYGGIKVASENAVRDVWGESAFIVRAGLITGHGDVSDRFGYWPARLAGTGRAVVPDVPSQPTQHIDVRDLAKWIIDAVGQRLGGTFNAAGRSIPFGELLTTAQAVAGGDAELVPVSGTKLLEAGVTYWSGPKSLPLWVPRELAMTREWDVQPAIDAGLRFTPAEDALAGALAYERVLGLDRPRKAGLTHAEEAHVLSLL
jgi:2'-hydroxyisoflavone reductase